MKNIYLFHGSDDFTISQQLKHWKSQFREKYSEDAMELLGGKTLNLNNFLLQARTMPFLSEKKLILIENFFADRKAEDLKEMAEILKQIPDSTIILFYESKSADRRTSLYKILAAEANVKEFNVPESAELAGWLLKKSATLGLKLPPAIANYIAEYCSPNLWTLHNELSKLAQFCQERPVTRADVENVCTPSLSASVFDLTDAIGHKKQRQALQTFHKLLASGEDPIKVFFLIISQFRTILQVKSLLPTQREPDIAKTLGKHPFVIKKTTIQTKNFSFEELKNAYHALQTIDHNFKTGKIKTYQQDNSEFILALEKFIICLKSSS